MRIASLQDRLVTVSSHTRARARQRPGRRAAIAAAVLIASLGGAVSEASSQTGSRPTLSAKSTFVVFNQHVKLTGTASTKRVTLLARHFGQTSYRAVATARVRNGRFEFSPVPELATSYEVSAGTRSVMASRRVQVYVHLDVTRFTCSLCRPPSPAVQRQLHYSLFIRVPTADYRFVASEPVYLYVGTANGKVQSEKRVGSVKPVRAGRSTVKVEGTVAVDVPAGWRVRFNACDRSAERRTGVGLPSVHDCGAPRLSHSQFKRYVG
jgi:hypothetical protein